MASHFFAACIVSNQEYPVIAQIKHRPQRMPRPVLSVQSLAERLSLVSQVLAYHYGEAGHDDGNHAHQLDEDIEGRTRRVLERIADCVTYYGSLVAF